MTILVVSCYHDTEYVRGHTIREATKRIPGVTMLPIQNTKKGLLRYPETLRALWRAKRTSNPSAIVLTFRGQELLPFVLLLAGKTPVIFDEYIVPIAYATQEKHARSFKTWLYHSAARVGTPVYNRCLRRCFAIVADTKAHAELGAKASNSNLSKYVPIPVGTNEKLFKPGHSNKPKNTFNVFFYGTMQPLHGVDALLDAALLLAHKPDIRFTIAGAKGLFKKQIDRAIANGAHIDVLPWVPFKELPRYMKDADLVLGGPFGGTRQAHHVVTTKTYQALACARPVVVGESQASNEYFVHRHNAIVIPQKEPGALARACTWAQAHPEELQSIALSGRKLFDKHFSVDAISANLAPLFARLPR